MKGPAILLLALTMTNADYGDELRIHENAEKGTRMTMSVELKKKLDGRISCFGILDTDIDWIEYREKQSSFYTTRALNYVNQKKRDELTGTLRLFCSGGQVFEVPFFVHITKPNRHSPSFSQPSYEIFVPLGTPIGGLVAQLEVTDHDPVIYNSQRTLSFKPPNHPYFTIFSDGSINLKSDIDPNMAYKKEHTQVVAVDYGSPQLHTEVNVTFIPVTVSQVRNLRVNVASDRYQIFEWDPPDYGSPEKYRLTIRKGELTLADEEVDTKSTKALTRVKVESGWDTTYSVSAVSVLGETPSPRTAFNVVHRRLECLGECSQGGGLPLCFYGPLNSLLQYEDANGKHCDCFPGYTGYACDTKEVCISERRVDAYGGLDWPQVGVNSSSRLSCPYNPDRTDLWRGCEWNNDESRAMWGPVKGTEKCQSQASVLTHLGMLATFAARADQLSTLSTVNNFIAKLLTVPSFSLDGPAHFDQKIAEHIVMVLESVIRVNLSNVRGNTTEIKEQLLTRISSLSSRLPIPYHLHSEGHSLAYNVIPWVPDVENFRTMVGNDCFVQLPSADEQNVARGVCMGNATLYDTVDTRNPVLTLTLDKEGFSFTKITFGLRPFNSSENYTCVFYDEVEQAWSTRGIRRVSPHLGGFVVCESSHLSSFSLLPDSFFSSSSSLLKDFLDILPTITSFIAIVCAIFLLFLAAIQRGRCIDYPLLVFLFLITIIQLIHLFTILAPQLGDIFLLSSPILHLIYQFCIISCSALCVLLANSMYSTVIAFKANDKLDPPLCSSFCSTLMLGIVVPAIFTATTYMFAQQNRHELSRVLTRLDWLFIGNFLTPCLIFSALTIVICLTAIKAASTSSRSLSSSSFSLSPIIHSSTSLLCLLLFFFTHIVLFVLREDYDRLLTVAFALCQLGYCILSFVFAGFLFRLRYMEVNGDDVSTRSLERKRDISRALLQHVDARPSEHESLGSALLSHPHTDNHLSTSTFLQGVNGHCGTVVLRQTPSTHTPSPPLILDSPNFVMTNSLFERTPMVSIV